MAQENSSLGVIRSNFQEISSEEDIKKIQNFAVDSAEVSEQQIIKAYQAAGTCMLANYVFSPMSKLKYFNQGKKQLDELIFAEKEVENIYLRLLLQLNVPKTLNYHDDIENDISYLSGNLTEADIESSYKKTMIKNLVSITKNKELKDTLLQIQVD